MKKLNYVTTTYLLEDSFLVDIVERSGGYLEAWLYHRYYGVKMYLFGMDEARERFIELVEANVADYIDDFRIEYMEEDI